VRQMRVQQFLILVLTLGTIVNAFIMRKQQKAQITLLRVVKQQDDTIKLQRHAIVELQNMLAQQRTNEPTRWN
jgi:hypothetical protein